MSTSHSLVAAQISTVFAYLFLALPHVVLSEPSSFDPEAIRCGANGTGTLLPTPSYGLDGAVFTVCSELLIDAPILSIYYTLIDFNNYGQWNTFVPQVSIDPNITTPDDVYIGLSMIFTSTGLIPGVNTTSTEVISVLNETDQVAVAAWGSNVPVEDLRTEHPTVLTAGADGLTRSVSYETYYGAGAVAVLAVAANLQREFERENEDLQGFIEGFG